MPRKTSRTKSKPKGKTKPQDATSESAIVDRLYRTILSRKGGDPSHSHTARLFARGPAKIAQKFGEESVEAVIEGARGKRKALIMESADVVYHMLVMWASRGVKPKDVWNELERREGTSGVAEKASRRKGRGKKRPGKKRPGEKTYT
ncbi:MAG: phosphoribosyl-ATP diphosphatase [Gemmatimonas sp.]